jgi:DNA-binding transcriptional MerR regulator
MTKADIARIVYERHGGISNREAARLVEVIFETIKRHLGEGEKVQITGFGTSWSAEEEPYLTPDWRGDAHCPGARRLPPSKLTRRRRERLAVDRLTQIPNKLFFKIGEVCEITDTQPYVLRYWESEFQALAPAKNSSGQRIYRRKDIETVLRIKQLLYDEGFTIVSAKRLRSRSEAGPSALGLAIPAGDRGRERETVSLAPASDGHARSHREELREGAAKS